MQDAIIITHVVVVTKPGSVGPGLNFAGPGRQKNEVIGPGWTGPENFRSCKALMCTFYFWANVAEWLDD